MSYIKTNWVDNVTPIDKDNLNKIEQGIYDNSLVADAVNNVVKPNDETYKDVEITEGQITDVLGVNDVLIKGNTLQDGEPTPDSPVDINVVSGSNVISTSNKNIWKMSFLQGSAKGTINNENFTITENSNDTYLLGSYSTSAPALFKIRKGTYKFSSNNSNVRITLYYVSSGSLLNLDTTFDYTTLSTDINIVAVRARGTSSLNGQTFGLQLELGQTATTYEPHQGKELPLDLPVENLLDKDNANVKNGYIVANIPTIGDNGATNKITYIEIKPNTTYTVSKNNFRLDAFGIASTVDIPAKDVPITQKAVDKFANSLTITTGANDNYLVVYCKGQGIIFPELFNNIDLQIEEGEKVNAYTPYGVAPIELCKIGDYQDYFYRDNGKWYLHKETKKVIFDGSEDWLLREDDGTNYCYSIGNVTDYKHEILDSYGFSNYFDVGKALGYHAALLEGIGLWFYSDIGSNNIYLVTNTSTTSSDLKTWLDSNNVALYYILASATNTEITDTTLISQLEAIYNAPLYEQTNITQTNNDLPMVLDITACKDNINGIKAWIRK